MCGCGTCNPGSQTFIDGTLYVCSGGCFAVSGGSGGGSSGGSGGGSGVGGDPCAGIDCNANPPVCGTCATCTCCNCSDGQTKNISGQPHICNGGCYQPLTGDGG